MRSTTSALLHPAFLPLPAAANPSPGHPHPTYTPYLPTLFPTHQASQVGCNLA